MRFKTIQPDNPILRAEINYQRRTIPRWLQWFDRFGVIVLVLAITLALFLLPLKDDSYGRTSIQLFNNEILNPLLLLLWISQVVVILRCIFAGINAMQRHRVSQQNNFLVLTGITRRQILIGRLWAILHQLRGWIVAFGIIKLAVFAFVVVSLIVHCQRSPMDRVITYRSGNRSSVEWFFEQLPDDLSHLPNISRIVLTGIHIPFIVVLEIMVSSAIGMLGGLLPQKVIGLIVAILVRFIPVISFSLRPDYPNATGLFLWRWYEYTLFSLVDGGSSGILRAGLIYRPDLSTNINQVTISALLAFWAAIIMYIVYIVFAFLISNFLLRRQGFLSAASK